MTIKVVDCNLKLMNEKQMNFVNKNQSLNFVFQKNQMI